MIINKSIKTTGESIDYLNKVVLGVSPTNGVIVKDYVGVKSLQDRVYDLENYGVNVDILNDINDQLNALTSIVAQWLDDPTGWVELTSILGDGNLFVKRIGEIVSIQGYFEYLNVGLIITTLPAQFIPTRDINIEVLDITTPKIYFAMIYSSTGNIVLDEALVSGNENHYINVTYVL